MNRKGRQTRRNYQVLRVDASPQGVNYISLLRRGSHGFAGLAPHFGRSSLPHSFVLCSGAGRLPFHHRGQGPQDNRVSIGKVTSHVNSIPLWKSTCQGFRTDPASHLPNPLGTGFASPYSSIGCSLDPPWPYGRPVTHGSFGGSVALYLKDTKALTRHL